MRGLSFALWFEGGGERIRGRRPDVIIARVRKKGCGST